MTLPGGIFTCRWKCLGTVGTGLGTDFWIFDRMMRQKGPKPANLGQGADFSTLRAFPEWFTME
jgi:hypothetical protein